MLRTWHAARANSVSNWRGQTVPAQAISEGIRENWWRQGMMGGIKAQTDCVNE
jgi:hypothetical protein